MSIKTDLLDRLRGLIDQGKQLESTFYVKQMGMRDSDVPPTELKTFVITAYSTIGNIGGKESEFYEALPQLSTRGGVSADYQRITACVGSLTAL
jgi:hypothetical protein